MSGLRFGMTCRGLAMVIGLLCCAFPGAARAQDAVAQPNAPAVLVVDQQRLFSESAFGKASLERERQASAELEAENNKIQAELVAEEQALTLQRKTLSAVEFSARADAFDQKVEKIRSEQDAKAHDLTQTRDKDVKEFLAAASPILGQLLADHGAGVVLDKSSVIAAANAVDVTDEAIALIDKVLGISGGNTAPNAP